MDPTAEATYLVQGIRAFGEATLSRAPGLRVLVHEPPEIQNTVVAVTMDATTLKNIDTESLGVIRSAEVRTFKSHTRNGTMEVDIENVGDLKTDYVVAITECNQNVVPAIPAQARVLQPSQTAILKFPIYTNGGRTNETTNQCLATLRSPTGRIYDSVTVVFDTIAVQDPPSEP
jgi:hypothetical protein